MKKETSNAIALPMAKGYKLTTQVKVFLETDDRQITGYLKKVHEIGFVEVKKLMSHHGFKNQEKVISLHEKSLRFQGLIEYIIHQKLPFESHKRLLLEIDNFKFEVYQIKYDLDQNEKTLTLCVYLNQIVNVKYEGRPIEEVRKDYLKP